MKALLPFISSLALALCLGWSSMTAQDSQSLLPENPVAGEGIGLATATDGHTIVTTTRFSRQAYVFERQGETWAQVAQLKGDNLLANGHESKGFGTTIAIDGNLMAIGAPESHARMEKKVGMVQLFAKVNGTWELSTTLRATETSENAEFGKTISAHDGRLLVGAPAFKYETGQAFLYTQEGENWNGQLLKSPVIARRATSEFGASVAIQGNLAVVGAPGMQMSRKSIGGVFIYQPGEDGNWELTDEIWDKQLESLGQSIALQGDLMAVGAYETILLYTRQEGKWVESGRLDNPDAGNAMSYGKDLDLSQDGQFLLVGASGKAYLFSRVTGSWELLSTIEKDEINFATQNAMGTDFFLLNSPYVGEETIDGAVYIYPLTPLVGGLIK